MTMTFHYNTSLLVSAIMLQLCLISMSMGYHHHPATMENDEASSPIMDEAVEMPDDLRRRLDLCNGTTVDNMQNSSCSVFREKATVSNNSTVMTEFDSTRNNAVQYSVNRIY